VVGRRLSDASERAGRGFEGGGGGGAGAGREECGDGGELRGDVGAGEPGGELGEGGVVAAGDVGEVLVRGREFIEKGGGIERVERVLRAHERERIARARQCKRRCGKPHKNAHNGRMSDFDFAPARAQRNTDPGCGSVFDRLLCWGPFA